MDEAREDAGLPVDYRFCPTYATPLTTAVPGGPMRPACPACGFVLFRTTVVGVVIVVQRNAAVLLGKRAGSYGGQWFIPCGYVEWDEDVRLGAEREGQEDT